MSDTPPGPLQWQPLAVEASHRRFYRVRGTGASHVVMASPPDLENNDQFVTLARLFAAHGIGVPRLLAEDAGRGFFLMTDLGDVHFADVYARRGPDAVLPAALATLHRLQAIDDPAIPPYSRQRFADELDIYVTWCLGALLGEPAPDALAEAFEHLLAATDAQPRCCVHRDFHARNLLLRDDGTAGVVDFQDALRGPATYDLASLLRDCYYQLPEDAVAHWRDVYLQQTPLPVDRARFAADLDLVALQRQLKAVGIFARLYLRDGRDSHLCHIVPVLERISTLAAAYPELRSLAEHTAAVLPSARARLEALA
ncbi:MAG: phosphotransferase [Gammaproteobacteria bacterium]|nr:phosphotransferase [Gammaproteobacteria bacterium]